MGLQSWSLIYPSSIKNKASCGSYERCTSLQSAITLTNNNLIALGLLKSNTVVLLRQKCGEIKSQHYQTTNVVYMLASSLLLVTEVLL